MLTPHQPAVLCVLLVNDESTIQCNCFNFYIGVSIWSGLSYALKTVLQFNGDMFALNNAAFNATFAAAFASLEGGNGGNQTEFKNTTKWVTDTFGYCNNTCFTMGLAMTSKFPGNFVNSFYKEVEQVYCNTAIFDSKGFACLITKPPISLNENYYECREDDITIFLNSIGIANGNTAILLPLFLTVLLPFLYSYFKFIGYDPPKKEYNQDEIDDAVKELITQVIF